MEQHVEGVKSFRATHLFEFAMVRVLGSVRADSDYLGLAFSS